MNAPFPEDTLSRWKCTSYCLCKSQPQRGHFERSDDGVWVLHADAAAEIKCLKAALERADRQHGETIDERDRVEAYADQLAEVIAIYTGANIGEHSSANNPWEEAHEAMLQLIAEEDAS